MRVFVLILVFGSFFVACDRRPAQKDLPKSEGNSVDHSGRRNSVIESSPNAPSAPYELQFLDTMIAHHESAIDMAQLAQTRAGHAEIKDLARRIIAGQRTEIDDMRALRDKFFAGAAPAINIDLPGIDDAMKGIDLEKLDDLKETPFDLEFIREMTMHHEDAVAMARDALSRLPASPENIESTDSVRQLAQRIIDTQTAEIRQMHDWRVAWTK